MHELYNTMYNIQRLIMYITGRICVYPQTNGTKLVKITKTEREKTCILCNQIY